MTGKITISGYLTQAKLEAAVHDVVGADRWVGAEQRVEGGRKHRWDMVFRDDVGELIAVEYDGDAHYRDSLKIKNDRTKDDLAASARMKVVRIPYWVQLTTETAKYYFGWDVEVDQDFPHGFITTKLFPASFCELGVERLSRELRDLPLSVRAAVTASLRARIAEHEFAFVLPSGLRSIVTE